MKKRIVLFIDGTWNAPWMPHSTNVQRLYEKTERGLVTGPGGGATLQVARYVHGIGSEGGRLRRIFEGATGYGISADIREAYEFLASEYSSANDEIFVFGFSRGAYTARSLVGLVNAVGLLEPNSVGRIPELYRAYQRNTLETFTQKYGDELKNIRDREIREDGILPIRFLGVWDTVGALGAPTPVLKRLTRWFGWVSFHNTELGSTVDEACQALAAHELRRQFEPAIWTKRGKPGQIIEQRWFVGAHSDVGGGYETRDLCDLSLQWMILRATGAGLRLRPGAIDDVAGNACSRIHESRTTLYKSAAANVRRIGPVCYADDMDPAIEEFRDESVDVRERFFPRQINEPHFAIVDELLRRVPLKENDPRSPDWQAVRARHRAIELQKQRTHTGQPSGGGIIQLPDAVDINGIRLPRK